MGIKAKDREKMKIGASISPFLPGQRAGQFIPLFLKEGSFWKEPR
jgi:hypothetical protein